jgi:hypothetical protein
MHQLFRRAGTVFCAFWFVASAAVPLPATASGAGASDRTASEFLDTNGDGQISYDEFAHSVSVKAMREMDTDKSGTLSPSEAAARKLAANLKLPTLNFADADANGDGQLSQDELEGALHDHPGVKSWFQNLDQDKDGSISQPELDRFPPGSGLQGVPQIVIPIP